MILNTYVTNSWAARDIFIYLVLLSDYNDRGMLDDWVFMHDSSAEFVPESYVRDSNT